MSQDVCPWNRRFARELPNASPFAARGALAGEDARTLAREVLGMSPAAFAAAFRGSPMKRAKVRGLKRNAAVVLGGVGTSEDADVLARALDDPEPLVREHAAWALERLGAGVGAVRRADDIEPRDAEPDGTRAGGTRIVIPDAAT